MHSRKQSERNRQAKEEKILLAAETVFTKSGFDGASMREIAREAGITLSLASYYFGSKKELFEQLVGRRAEVVVSHRRHLLLQERMKANPDPIPVDRLVWAYVTPFLEKAQSNEGGWRNYTTLISHTANSPQWSNLIAENYDSAAREFLSELSRTLPHADYEDLVLGLTFVVNGMMGIAARTQRSDLLSDGAVKSDDLEKTSRVLCRFLTGGLLELNRHRGQK